MFVDWPHAAVGNAVFDVVAWAPSVVLEGGPAARGAAGAPRAHGHVDPEVVTVLLAAVSGFFV